MVRFDHLVVAAENLEQGIGYVKEQLGVEITYGGEHPKMGTHNHLARIGEDCFLEVIAACPGLPSPSRPRWFGLDDPLIRRILESGPGLLAWVVNCDDIERLLAAASCSLGRADTISRGGLSWEFGLPADGRLLGGGFIPYAIQWHTAEHPAQGMAEANCRFRALELYHPCADWLTGVLDSIGASGLVKIVQVDDVSLAGMRAIFDTPTGPAFLRSPFSGDGRWLNTE